MLTTIMIGNKIAEARKAKNLSQAQLAQHLSISSQAVGKWERGESLPDIITFNRLAEIFGVDLNYFSESFPAAAAAPAEKPSAAIELPSPVEPAAEWPPVAPEKKLTWDLSAGNWVDLDFSGLKNLGEKFSGSNLQRCLFIGSEMSGLLLKGNNVDGCDFSKSNLNNSHFQGSSIVNSSFKDSPMKEAQLSASEIKNCNFTGVDFTRAVFRTCELRKTVMTGAVWHRTAFNAVQFTDIVFDSNFNGCSFEACYFTRVTFQNVTLTDTFFKNESMKKVRFVDCKADKLTYAFLKSVKANLDGITLLTN